MTASSTPNAVLLPCVWPSPASLPSAPMSLLCSASLSAISTELSILNLDAGLGEDSEATNSGGGSLKSALDELAYAIASAP